MPAVLTEFQAAVHDLAPVSAVVLGSGLGSASHFNETLSISFRELPGFPGPTVCGHAGRIAIGTWNGLPALVFFGRLHFYEGHSWETVTAPVRLAAEFGIKRLILTNAAGGIRPDLQPGSLMAVRGHIAILDAADWKEATPKSPYSSRLIELSGLPSGVYAALTGPSYETPAEIRALSALGADAVGMSTAREAEAASQLGLEIAAISCITNRAAGLGGESLGHAEVLANARAAAERLAAIIGQLMRVP